MKEGRTIVFCDQLGFYLLPTVVRTYAPMGETPILREHLSRDHLSAMSGITLEGKLYMLEQDRSFKGEDVVRFLKHLMHQIPGKLLIVWDGSPIHRSRAVKEFLASGASLRVRVEQLPGYAPDLNPDEGVWKHLKCVEVEEPLLPEPCAVKGGATQSEGAIETQEARYPRLHKTPGFEV